MNTSECRHLVVTEQIRTYPATRFQPAESEARYICHECGAILDFSDLPKEVEIK